MKSPDKISCLIIVAVGIIAACLFWLYGKLTGESLEANENDYDTDGL